LKELFASYDAFAAGRAPVLPPLSVQFADFAIWQRQQLAAGRWDGPLEYWQKRLEALPPAAQLPVERQRPFAQTFAGAQIRRPFDAKLYAQLLSACAREGVTPYMWLHAAFQAFLFRYTGQSDIVVGTGVANRESTEAQKLLGMIINTVALRISFAGNPSFRDILVRARAAIVEALDNQNAPFDRVVQQLGGGTALFNAFFDSYDRAYPALHSDVLRVEQDIAINNGTSKFELVALVVPGYGTPATLLWEYNTDLFSEQTASRMMRHFLALLAESIVDPSLPVALLPMLSQEEKNRVIEAGWGKSSVSSPDRRLDQIFAAVVSAHPDSVAIVCGNEKLTYRELHQRATRLADELRGFGACNGQVVAFSLPRSPQAICVMAAILKSGGAYLPLDPKLPSDRRTLMLQAAGSSLLLTTEGIARVGSGPQQCPDLLPEDAACVLFTSGSTGVPKPVCVPHRAIARLVCNVEYVRLNADTRFLQLAPLAFDASSLEIWGPLLNGGAVIIHPEDVPDFAALGRTIASHGVTTAWLTASLLNQIIDAAPEILRPLRQLLTGGEALSVPHVVRALAALPSTTLINAYGPTEGTTFSTTFTIPRDFDFAVGRVPIGRPIPGTQVYVLDEYQQPLPNGVPGEICIGGTGLAASYLGDAALTAAKFVPDTISGLPDARLYRTGDCGRLLADGTLDCIGRLDRQVKVRGFRIEPGEIEAALLKHPCVAQAVVIAREDTPGDKRLVAYVVGASDYGMDAGALRAHLGRSLPSYMVPTAFVVLERLPLAPNGKLDQHGLPKPEQGSRQSDDSFVAPRSPTETALARIWCELLGVERVGIHDNFFELGGHSLLTVQLRFKIQRILQIEVPLADIYKWPTIEGIALSVLQKEPIVKKQLPSVVQLRAGSPKLPLYFIGAGPWEIRLAQLIGVEHSVFGVEFPWPLSWRDAAAHNETAALPTLDQFVAPLVAALSDHVRSSPCVLAGYSFQGAMAFEAAHQLQRLGVKVKMVMLLDTWLNHPDARSRWRRLLDTQDKLRRRWIRVRAERSVESIGSRLLFYCWILAKCTEKISRILVKCTERIYQSFRRSSFTDLSPQFDEQGVPVPWPLVRRLYDNARKCYNPRPLDCHGVLFRADPNGEKYQEYVHEFEDSLGWKGLFAKGLEVNLITANHYTIIGESLARKMTEVLDDYLDERSPVKCARDPERRREQAGEAHLWTVRAGKMGSPEGVRKTV
jgi:aspartate racemase